MIAAPKDRRVRIRDYHADDLDGIVRLWELSHQDEPTPVYSLAEVIASCQADHAVVAMRDERVVGAAVGRAAHAQGWVVFFATLGDARADQTGAALLDGLERRMASLGLAKLSILVSDTRTLDDFAASGFDARHQLRYLERSMPVQRRELDLLKEVGGRMLSRDLWNNVAGMRREKALLEERLVIPLSRPGLAERYGVVPPRAVMLFGPPGTGKTTFARAVASRLGWPFVELFPSRLSDSRGGLAGALRAVFERLAELEHAVVFIDEVEEIASRRRGEPPSPTQGVTNELLKLLADFRSRDGQLLICATNFIRALDAAFLRHGRFDYVLPIGLPDAEARGAIWARYVPQSVAHRIDFGSLSEHSEGFTPADIEHAARSASQVALSRALSAGDVGEEEDAELSTADYLTAVGNTRATVSEEAVRTFGADIESLARL